MDDVAIAGTGPDQRPFDPQAAQTFLDVGHGLVVGEVGEGHGPQGGAPEHHERPVGLPHDLDPLGQWSVDDDGGRRHQFGRPGLAHQQGQTAEEGGHTLSGHGRDLEVGGQPVIVGTDQRGAEGVGLGPHQEAGPLEEFGTVTPQFVEEDPVSARAVGPRRRRPDR